MRKGICDRRTRLAVGEHGSHFQMRMARDQTQQFAGDVAGAAQHNGRRRSAALRDGTHSPITLDSRTLRKPSDAMM